MTKKNLPQDFKKVSWVAPFYTTNAPFRSCISRTNSAFIDNAEYLDMSMCNLLEYSSN